MLVDKVFKYIFYNLILHTLRLVEKTDLLF